MTRHALRRGLWIIALVPCCLVAIRPAQADERAGPDDAPIVESDQAIGRLRRHAPRRKGEARYVLIGRDGRVESYVRSAGDVDLESYVDKVVRVRGQVAASPVQGLSVFEVADIAPAKVAAKSRRPAVATRPSRTPKQAVREVDYQEPLPAAPVPEEVPETEVVGPQPEFQPWDGYESNTPCDSCDQLPCTSCCGCFCGPPGRVWVRAEYLYWFTQGMQIPPLVTTGPSVDQPGYLNSPGTQILFGNGSVNTSGRSGLRLTVGVWLNAAQTVGIEGDYLWLANASTHYSASSNGTPILSRPFYDLSPTQADPSMIVGQNVENVAAPGIIAGSVSVDAQTVFQTGGLRALLNLCCSQQCYSNSFLPGLNGPGARRVDLLVGYRYGRLNDSLAINENLTSLVSTEPGSFHVNDSFATRNVFNGVELGTSLQNYRGRWSLEMMMKMAFGNTLQSVDINGYTTTTQNGSTTTEAGGLLAQSTNIGHYSRNQMAVMPQLGANLGYQLTPRLRVLAGYTFLYWSNVVRAGNQIDFDVNSRLLPNDTRPLAGDTQHPQFAFQTSDFWAQGINAGVDYRW